MKLIKQLTVSFIIILFLVIVGLALNLNRLALLKSSENEFAEEWEEYRNSVIFQDALGSLIYDLAVAVSADQVSAKLYHENVNNVLESFTNIKICTIDLPGQEAENTSHAQKEEAQLSTLKAKLDKFLKDFQISTDEIKNNHQNFTKNIEQLLEIKEISLNLQNVYHEGVIDSLKISKIVQKQVHDQTVYISILIIFVIGLTSLLTVIHLNQETLKLIHKERIETIGLLARSFAHEIRNPLGIIKSSADLISKKKLSDADERELAGYLVEEVTRIDDLLFQFLSLADHRQTEKSPQCVAPIIEQCIALLEGELNKSGVLLKFENNAPDAKINCNKNQIKQVVLNLFINAIHASKVNDCIVVSFERKDRKLFLRVKDFGKGLTKKEIRKLYDPFYTTKQEGFGIGLSVVKKIIDDHNAKIIVTSKIHHGTTFEIQFEYDKT